MSRGWGWLFSFLKSARESAGRSRSKWEGKAQSCRWLQEPQIPRKKAPQKARSFTGHGAAAVALVRTRVRTSGLVRTSVSVMKKLDTTNQG